MRLRTPEYVQRCGLEQSKTGPELIFHSMKAPAFSEKNREKSITQITATKVCTGKVDIYFRGKQIPVYMIAGEGFPFTSYQRYLQQLSEDKLLLREQAHFNHTLQAQFLREPKWSSATNVWFDIKNCVMWTLFERHKDTVVQYLEQHKMAVIK
jgi:hypothetical protein